MSDSPAEQVLQVAQVLSLLVADKTGGLSHSQKPGKSKPHEAQRAPAPLTSEEALRQAQAEGLLVPKNKTGYFGVTVDKRGRAKPYKAQLKREAGMVTLGCFATAEEAALCVARTPEGRAAAAAQAEAAAEPIPLLRSQEARRQAQAEGLTLRLAKNMTGYLGVRLDKPGQPKPYQARVTRGGTVVSLGHFVTAEEAALCVARPNQQPCNRQATAALERAAEARKAAASITALHEPAVGLTLLEEAIARRTAPPEAQAVGTVDGGGGEEKRRRLMGWAEDCE
jgi:hypothetical protein